MIGCLWLCFGKKKIYEYRIPSVLCVGGMEGKMWKHELWML
jgi:hypothetical protein